MVYIKFRRNLHSINAWETPKGENEDTNSRHTIQLPVMIFEKKSRPKDEIAFRKSRLRGQHFFHSICSKTDSSSAKIDRSRVYMCYMVVMIYRLPTRQYLDTATMYIVLSEFACLVTLHNILQSRVLAQVVCIVSVCLWELSCLQHN